MALKVIKSSLASPSLLRRFEQESGALARLHHPGINQDVGGLQIAMDDAALVSVVHGIADLRNQLQALPRIQVARVRVLR